MQQIAQEALSKLSQYLPANRQSTNEVFLAVVSAFDELERQLAEANAEIKRLLDIVQREPDTAYLEAVQRACDENLTALKHAERNAVARAEAAERQLDCAP